MIKINIYQDPAVFFKSVVEDPFTLFKKRMGISKRVNIPMHFDPFHNIVRNVLELITLQMICYEISNNKSGITA